MRNKTEYKRSAQELTDKGYKAYMCLGTTGNPMIEFWENNEDKNLYAVLHCVKGFPIEYATRKKD